MRSKLIVLFAALLALGACDAVAERAAEEVVEQAGGAEDVDVDPDSGDVRIETSEGTFESGAGLPDDFPEAVPLPEGVEVVQGSRTEGADGTVWNASFEFTSGTPSDAFEQYAAQLEDAGFTASEDGSVNMTNEAGGLAGGQFMGHGYQLMVSVVGDPDDFLFGVIVSEAPPSDGSS